MKPPSLESFPTELVIKILGLLPLDDLLLKARLVNRMWNLLSNAQLASWALSLRHAVAGDIEIMYNRLVDILYKGDHVTVLNEVKVTQQQTLSLSFEASESWVIATQDLRVIKRVELCLTANFCGSTKQELLEKYR
jgi:hypothetical protein